MHKQSGQLAIRLPKKRTVGAGAIISKTANTSRGAVTTTDYCVPVPRIDIYSTLVERKTNTTAVTTQRPPKNGALLLKMLGPSSDR